MPPCACAVLAGRTSRAPTTAELITPASNAPLRRCRTGSLLQVQGMKEIWERSQTGIAPVVFDCQSIAAWQSPAVAGRPAARRALQLHCGQLIAGRTRWSAALEVVVGGPA